MFEGKLAQKKRRGGATPADHEVKCKDGAVHEQQQQQQQQQQQPSESDQQRHRRFVSLPVRAPLILSRVEFDANRLRREFCPKRSRSSPPPPAEDNTEVGTDARKKLFRIPMAKSAGEQGFHCADTLASHATEPALDCTAATARLLVASGLHITPGSKFGCNWLA